MASCLSWTLFKCLWDFGSLKPTWLYERRQWHHCPRTIGPLPHPQSYTVTSPPCQQSQNGKLWLPCPFACSRNPRKVQLGQDHVFSGWGAVLRPSLASLTGFGPPLLHGEMYLCWEGWGWDGLGYIVSWAFRNKQMSMDYPGLPAVFPPGESSHPQTETSLGFGPGLAQSSPR